MKELLRGDGAAGALVRQRVRTRAPRVLRPRSAPCSKTADPRAQGREDEAACRAEHGSGARAPLPGSRATPRPLCLGALPTSAPGWWRATSPEPTAHGPSQRSAARGGRRHRACAEVCRRRGRRMEPWGGPRREQGRGGLEKEYGDLTSVWESLWLRRCEQGEGSSAPQITRARDVETQGPLPKCRSRKGWEAVRFQIYFDNRTNKTY